MLLLINPHTSFYHFRSELQMTSEEGLNAYGAQVTWGQFFIYQGFNEHAGWMHTTPTVDVVDEFAETILQRDGQTVYRHGDKTRPVETKPVTLQYRVSSGALQSARLMFAAPIMAPSFAPKPAGGSPPR